MVLIASAALVLVGSVGVAVDIGRGQMTQARLQSAVDAASLAAGATTNTNDIQAVAEKYVTLNFTGNTLGARVTDVEATLSDNKKLVTVSAQAEMPTSMMKLFNDEEMEIAAASEVTRTNKGLEVALVLDTTGSMSGSPLIALKNASTNLVNILYGSNATVDNLWVGVVPFSQTVNIGSSRTDWLDAAHFAGLNWFDRSWGGCVEARHSTGRDVTDDPPFDLALPNVANPAPPYQRLRAYYAPPAAWNTGGSTNVDNTFCQSSASCTCANHGPCNTWTAISANRAQQVTCSGSGNNRSCKRTTRTFRVNASTGPNTNCPSPVTPLTNDKATILSGIDALEARGMTHVNFGAVWGWRLVSPRWRGYWGGGMDANNLPLDYNTPLMSKAVIIMTDGVNTTGHYSAYPNGSNITSAQLNTKTTQVCNAMKAQGVIVYTILFQDDDDTIKTLLRQCATNPDYFFDSPTADDLNAAFQTIGDSLANLRISQ